jgi:nicotinate phosphoribosyltransferase
MKKYSAIYFKKTSKIIKKIKPNSIVTIQFFQRKNKAIFAGINEVLELLEKNTNTFKYQIKYLKENSKINSKDVVLELKGNYSDFGIYEGIIDGILTRATSLATNARKILKAAKNKKVICMSDRSDHYINQENDGKYIAIGGIKTQVTEAQVLKHDGKAIGTIPHILIQMFNGDLIKALKAYEKIFPKENLIALVDFNNDVISDSLKAFKEFGNKLKAVRVDTAGDVSDVMFKNNEEYGVTPNLIKNLRNALNNNDANKVKIIVSSGFDEEKIKLFEKENTPVDYYGVGASLLKIKNYFTADAVEIDGKKIAKKGRKKQNTSLLKIY